MKTINVSDEAYKRILKQKQKMEEKQTKVVFIVHALDVLLGVREDV
jgi:hypothetical protein